MEATLGLVLEDTTFTAVACLEGRNRLNVVENVYRHSLGNFFVYVTLCPAKGYLWGGPRGVCLFGKRHVMIGAAR